MNEPYTETSEIIAFLLEEIAATPVIPVPENPSKTKSPSSV